MPSNKLHLFLYKDTEANIALLIWASCISDASDRVAVYLHQTKKIDSSLIRMPEIRRKTNRLREPKYGTILEEFQTPIYYE